MPIISIFYGLIIYMFNEEGSPHNIPHIHVEYSGRTAVVDLKGNILRGELPGNKRKILEAWMMLHEEELEVCWALILKGEPHIKIEPLR